jgi:hypothetical protein
MNLTSNEETDARGPGSRGRPDLTAWYKSVMDLNSCFPIHLFAASGEP